METTTSDPAILAEIERLQTLVTTRQRELAEAQENEKQTLVARGKAQAELNRLNASWPSARQRLSDALAAHAEAVLVLKRFLGMERPI